MAGRRKRPVKKDPVAAVEVEEEAEVPEEPVVKKGRRGAATKNKGVEEKEEEEEMEVKEEEPEEEKEAEEEEEEEEQTPPPPPPAASRAKRGARKVTNYKEAEEIDDEEDGMKKLRRVRKVKKEEEEPGTSVVKKRGRAPPKKKVAPEDSEPAIKKETEPEESEPVVKKTRGRKAPVKKEDDEEEEAASPPAAAQKGRKGRAAAKVKSQEEEEEEEDAPPSPPPKNKTKRAPNKKALKVTEEEEEEEDLSDDGTTQGKAKAASSAKASGGRNAKPKGARGKKGAAKGGATAEEKENTDTTNLQAKSGPKSGVERVVVMKGRAAVDALCPIAQHSHVYEDKEEDEIWDCMLNQTNIQFNNNKFYIIQLLEDDSSRSYSVWMRWGRVGVNGQNSLKPCGTNLMKATEIFRKKFSDKTSNEWELRDMFDKVPGKYDLLRMDYSKGTDTPDTSAAVKVKPKAAVESQLHAKVRAVIELICDVRRMEEAVVEMKYDAKKAPLGKLTEDQIKAGYLALKRIDELLESGKYKQLDLVHACNDFYTRVPHCFGMKVPPLIRNKVDVKEKVLLLEALGDIQAALSVMDQPIDVDTHPADHHYRSLKCDLMPLEQDSQEYRIIEKYLSSTHAKTHNHYRLELQEVLACRKDYEHTRFKDVGNRMLLWHGSRMSNWAGILSQGLRIAPPEAPVTGYMFGKGIYFADMASKSANYCWANAGNDVGFLMLSEVSLGKCNEILQADYNADRLPAGCHSVKGCGRTAPQLDQCAKLPDGTLVPMGPGVQVGSKTASNYSLLYNEYIVYNPAQVLTRFLLKVKFNFK